MRNQQITTLSSSLFFSGNQGGQELPAKPMQRVLFYIRCASSRDRDQSILRFYGRPSSSLLLLCHTLLLLDLASADHRSEQIRVPKGKNSPTARTNGLSPFLPFISGLANYSGHQILTPRLLPHTTTMLCITLEKVGACNLTQPRAHYLVSLWPPIAFLSFSLFHLLLSPPPPSFPFLLGE